jgi:hypothetical protein
MSAETDVALMVEIEDKIDQRIRDSLHKAMYGYTSSSPVSAAMAQAAVASSVKNNILNDTGFIAELTRRIGQKMQNVTY